MRNDNFAVSKYSLAELKRLLVKYSEAPEHVVRRKMQVSHLDKHLKSLGARTIVAERKYVDRHFLDDYAAYYAYCWHEYKPVCARLHFFDIEFGGDHDARTATLETFLRGEGVREDSRASNLKDCYLGYMVVKPLPEAIIGRTCLRLHPPEGFFRCTRRCPANAFGVEFEVQSIAFQEQDKVAAACATSALWSVFQGSGTVLHHHIPSPVEITKAAARYEPVDVLPDAGLTIGQMSQVIRDVGKLEPHCFEVPFRDQEHRLFFKTVVYTYLHIVPLILTVNIPEVDGTEGWHAVAVVGCRLGIEKPEPWPDTGFLIKASCMDEIYVHDDQVGPFTPMSIKDSCLTTAWPGGRAEPGEVLFPLRSMIRISVRRILDLLIRFDAWLEILRVKGLLSLEDRLVWDIYPTLQSDLKKEIRGSKCATPKCRRDILQAFISKFLWRAVAYCSGNPVFELLFDATDVELHTGFWPVEYKPILSEHCAVIKYLKNAHPNLLEAVFKIVDRRFIQRLCEL